MTAEPDSSVSSLTLPSFATRQRIWLAAAGFRLALLIYGFYHDAHFRVKYTDIDYEVFTDASHFVAQGGSPYDRATYRYTPLLAWMMLPNVFLWKPLGKLVFIAADLFVAAMIERLLQRLGTLSSSRISLALALWLFNPLTLTISTRGNADVLVGALVLGSLEALVTRRLSLSAVLFGLAVHFKIYPIIYTLPFMLFLGPHYTGEEKHSKRAYATISRGWSNLWGYLNKERLHFALMSASVFFLLLGLFYGLYGFKFLYETYFYHLVRQDNRHNFSVYFYDLYLNLGNTRGALMSLLAFFPQMTIVAVIGWKFALDLPACFFMQTLAFVAFNKVCTAQYFVWWIVYLPFVQPHLRIERWKGAGLLALWFASEVHWLFWGYKLEFLGQQVFLGLWTASLVFFFVNALILRAVVRHGLFVPTPVVPRIKEKSI